MREAVALAAVIGADSAAEQLGMRPGTVRKWQAKAGRPPELQGQPDQWQALHDLAMARTTTAVASGSLPVRTVAVIAGIAARNLRVGRQPVTPPPDVDPDDPTPLASAAGERLEAFIDGLLEPAGQVARRYLRAAIDDAQDHHAEHGQPVLHGSPREQDAAIAAVWDRTREWIAEHLAEGPEHFAHVDAVAAARNRQRALAARFLFDDEADLLIEADQYLEEQP